MERRVAWFVGTTVGLLLFARHYAALAGMGFAMGMYQWLALRPRARPSFVALTGFAWLAGVGDMLAAIGAVFLGSALLQGRTVSRRRLLAWNTFGLLDFVIAVIVGTALRSVYLGGDINTDAMALLPLSLVPTVIVPLYIITHLAIYLQLSEKNGMPANPTR